MEKKKRERQIDRDIDRYEDKIKKKKGRNKFNYVIRKFYEKITVLYVFFFIHLLCNPL